MIKLAIDPGHGMANRRPGKYDPGATSWGAEEATICLQFAEAVRWVAQQEFEGIRVMLTRVSNSDPAPLSLRAPEMGRAGAQAFISLHCNSSLNPFARGTEIFARDSADRKLAEMLLPRICSAMGTKNRGVKPEGQSQHSRLAVLDFGGPSCLVELAFITNPAERKKLQERERRIAVARKILIVVKELCGPQL